MLNKRPLVLKLVLLCFSFLIFMAMSASYASAAAPKVTAHQVNGYDVYLVDVQSGNTFGYTFSVPFGSADDPPALFGRAHRFEHQMGRGSIKYPGHATLIQKMSSIGFSRNAATGLNMTYYFAYGNEENALEALDYGLAPLDGLKIDPQSFIDEHQTVTNEVIGSAPNRPERGLFALPFAHQLPVGHPLQGHHVGDQKTLGAMTAQDLMDLHEQVYRPGNVKVAITANFTSGRWTREQILENLKSTLPNRFKRQIPFRAHASPPGPLFGLNNGKQILEVESKVKPLALIAFSLPVDADILKTEVFFDIFSLINRGGINNYLAINKGWVSDFGGGTMRVGDRYLGVLSYNMTDEGYANRDRIVQQILSAVKLYQREPVPESVMQMYREGLAENFRNVERDVGTLVAQLPAWMTTPMLDREVMMDWPAVIARYSSDNVMSGARGLNLHDVAITFQGPEPIASEGTDPVYQVKYARRHLPATAQFPVSLPVSPATVQVSHVNFGTQIQEGKLISARTWKTTADYDIIINSHSHWVDRTIQINFEFGLLTAPQELAMQALVSGFNEEFSPELMSLGSKGVDVSIFPGTGTMTMAVKATSPSEVAALRWLVEKFKTYKMSESTLQRFKENFSKSLRNREQGFPANIAVQLSHTLLSPRGLNASLYEKALPAFSLTDVNEFAGSGLLAKANKRLIFAGAFYESEIKEAQAIASEFAPENLGNKGAVIGTRLAVKDQKLTLIEPWLSPTSEGIATSRLYKSAAPTNLAEHGALIIVRHILHDRIFLANRPFGYVQGAGPLSNNSFDHHIIFYGQAENESDLAKLHQNWDAAIELWRKGEVTDEEIENARAGVLASWQEKLSTSAEGAAVLSSMSATRGHPFAWMLAEQVVPLLTADEIRATAAKYLNHEAGRLTIIKGKIKSLSCDEILNDRAEVRERLKL